MGFLLKSFIFGILVFSALPRDSVLQVKRFSFFLSLGIFAYTLLLWFGFNRGATMFAEGYRITWFDGYELFFGVDGISSFFVLLTTFILFICVCASFFSVKKNLKMYLQLLFVLGLLPVAAFTVFDFFVFYLLFESLLPPMFLLIGFWGSNVRRMKAAYYLFLYTLTGSLLLLISLLLIGLQVGSFNWYLLLSAEFSYTRELFLWPGIFIAFAIKVPMFPFHIWLPEAHVEAPTGGSIVLASLLLKLGTYGFLRYLFPLFPVATAYYSILVFVFALLGIFYSSLVALRQLDLKRIIAYSSIAHMNFGVLGLFSLTFDGVLGGLFVMLGHGLISGALFYLVGVLYDRHKTRVGFYYSGLAVRMPLFAFFLFFFVVSNIGFPGTFNFVAELLILLGLALSNLALCICSALSLWLTTVFTFWLYNRLVFGTPKLQCSVRYYDVTLLETLILLFLAVLTLLFGFFPNAVLGLVELPVAQIILI